MTLHLLLSAVIAGTVLGPYGEEAAATPASCQSALHQCMFSQCDGPAVEQACALDALTPHAAGIVRTEVRNAYRRVREAGDAQACAAAFDEMWRDAEAQTVNSPLRLDYGSYDSLDAVPSAERPTVYRAELDQALTRAFSDVHASGQWSCSVPAQASVVLLRAQNLAYAQDRALLRALDDADGALASASAIWLIYLHADLWQAEQRKASEVFDALAGRGRFPERLAGNLNARVGAHQPLYEDADLSLGWPEESD